MCRITESGFHAVFVLSRLVSFEVSYYILGNNKEPYFATSAFVFTKSKLDYSRGGQGQPDILPPYKTAYEFFNRWDDFHLKKLSDNEYEELKKDMEILFEKYPYHKLKQGTTSRGFNFRDVRELSMTFKAIKPRLITARAKLLERAMSEGQAISGNHGIRVSEDDNVMFYYRGVPLTLWDRKTDKITKITPEEYAQTPSTVNNHQKNTKAVVEYNKFMEEQGES